MEKEKDSKAISKSDLKVLSSDYLVDKVIELQNKNQELVYEKEMYFKQYVETKRREEALTSIVKSLSQLL